MKISADTASEHYIGAANAGRYEVELNGKRVQKVVEADDVEGYVVFYLRDTRGNPVFDSFKGGLARERMTGRVRIIDTRPPAKAAPGGIFSIRP